MNQTGRYLLAAALAGALATSGALAQSGSPAQNQANQNQSQSQNQNQGQANQDPYTGVSHPPPDDTIQADEDPTPAPAPIAKPSAAIPMTAPAATPAPAVQATPAPAPAPAPAAAAKESEDGDYGIVTTVPAAQPAGAADANDNTDFGIVTKVPEKQAPEADGGADNISLKRRGSFNPDDDIVNVVPSDPNALNAGTNITVRLLDALSTNETEEGSAFRATVIRDVYKGGSVIIPAGSEMRGRVVFVSEGHHIGPHATIRLRPDYVILPDRTAYHLYAQVVESYAPNTRINDEGGIQASRHYTKDALEYGGSVGTGAVAGAVIAGPVGAGLGSLVGATLVTTHLLVQAPQQAELPKGSELVFSLTEPMALTPARN